MTVDSWQMHVQMFWQMACRCTRRWINCRWQCKGQGLLRPDHKALSEELDRSEKEVAQWSKWLGCSPGLERCRFEPCLIHTFLTLSQFSCFQRNIHLFKEIFDL